MSVLSGCTTAMLLAAHAFAARSHTPVARSVADTITPVAVVAAAPVVETTGVAPDTPDTSAVRTVDGQPGAVAMRPVALRAATARAMLPLDTVPRRRAKAVVYSDAYGTRLKIHKTLSWAMLPLFAVSYVTGDQLIKKGSDAPDWARNVHPAAATGTAVLFGANAITGTWNLWDSRHDPNGRVRRYVHSILFMAASGGFAYTGTKLAQDAQESQARRGDHKNGAIISMGVSTASWLLMLVKN